MALGRGDDALPRLAARRAVDDGYVTIDFADERFPIGNAYQVVDVLRIEMTRGRELQQSEIDGSVIRECRFCLASAAEVKTRALANSLAFHRQKRQDAEFVP